MKTFRIVLLFVLSCAAAQAQFIYTTDNDTVTITGYNCTDGAVIIPDTIDGMPVTGIGNSAFSNCTSLTSVIVPDSVTSIGDNAFVICTGLTAVTIGNSVISIGSAAFAGCTSLTRVIIGNSVTSIGLYTFWTCTSLTSIIVPESVTSIEREAFSACSALNSVYFDGNAPSPAGVSVFQDCPTAIVYYREEATDWGPTYAGRPTALRTTQPIYSEWVGTTELPAQYPDSSTETDDPDQDGMTNFSEMLAGTDPTDPASVLILELVARPSELTDPDQTPIEPNQRAVYVRSVPGKTYGVQWADSWSGPWNLDVVVAATTTQKRFVIDRSMIQGFFRVILAQ